MQPELPELLLIPPMEEDEKAVLDYREEHFAVGENELHGACMLESIASFSDWLRRVRGNRRAETVFPPGLVANRYDACPPYLRPQAGRCCRCAASVD